MELKTIIEVNSDNENLHELLKEEDYNFKTKDIIVNLLEKKNPLKIEIITKNLLDFKIATNSIQKSLLTIEKVEKIIEDERI